MSSTHIYSQFVKDDNLISPVNGYVTKRITKTNIHKFGFESVELLLQAYPDFPLVCLQTKVHNKQASKAGRMSQLDREQTKYMESPNHCSQCGAVLSYRKRSTKFCNSSCSATYNNTRRPPASKAKRSKTSTSLKWFHATNPDFAKQVKLNSTIVGGRKFTSVTCKQCTCCNKQFYTRAHGSRSKTTCSPECARINSTYKKITIPYEHLGQTILLESSWELAMAQWLDSLNVEWVRPSHLPWIDKKGKKRKYFPDFYLPKYNVYLDPKNAYQISISLDKLEYICARYTLIYGQVEDIQRYVENLICS